jgi:8-oxo-dGTP pyrophosphatase MutT (NUDIX family)
MAITLPSEVLKGLEDVMSTLETPYKWRAVTSYFRPEVPERSFTSNVHVVPFIGDACVLLHTAEAGWSTPGGTLLEGEAIETAVTRELSEEIGAEPLRFELFGQWESESSAPTPYRPWLPHPRFAIAVGWADVRIVGSPKDDGGVEMETVQEIVITTVKQAAARLMANDRPHLAALYRLAEQVRKASQS